MAISFMNNKILCLLMAVCLLLSGCYSTAEPVTTSDTGTTASATEATTQKPEPERTAPSYPETEVKRVEYNLEIFSMLFECEKGNVGDGSRVDMTVGGFSGEGYVVGSEGFILPVEVPSNQHYSITVCAYAEKPTQAALSVNGTPRGSFTVGGTGEYECVMFDNIYLEEGETLITFAEPMGIMIFDYVALKNCTTAYTKAYTFDAKLSNKKASESASRLYRYLCEAFGEYVITSQQVTQGSNDELDEIYYTTGRYPAIRFSDMMNYGVGIDSGDTELALEWAEQGGIVGYDWYWVKDGSCYADKTDFDLTKCVSDHDVARLNEKRLGELYASGGVSDETISLLEDIDRVAEQLTKLKDADVAVLFRPLPQASGGQFWWSVDRDAYIWLYELIYARLCDYWHLDNIIWIWNGQSADWYVGDGLCDIIGVDIYDFSQSHWDNQSHINQLINITEMCNHKPIAITECNVLPSPNYLSVDHAFWSFVNLWSGSALDKNGELNRKYISENEWVTFYNCSLTLSRDEISY